MPETHWKKVADFPGYEVSSLGQVRSLPGGRRSGTALKSVRCQAGGHLTVSLHKKGKQVFCLVHRLVLEAFVGPCPESMECRHLNGDPGDNRLENLCWGTPKENAADRAAHKRTVRGRRVHSAKLTADMVRRIRHDAKIGVRQVVLASKHGVSQAAIWKILNNKVWRHV